MGGWVGDGRRGSSLSLFLFFDFLSPFFLLSYQKTIMRRERNMRKVKGVSDMGRVDYN